MTVRDRLAWAWPLMAAVAAGATLVVMVAAIVGLGQQRHDAADSRERLFAIARTLVECTTPSPVPPPEGTIDRRTPDQVHECYEDGAARTGAAVGSINVTIDEASKAVACTAVVLARPAAVPPQCLDEQTSLRAQGVIP